MLSALSPYPRAHGQHQLDTVWGTRKLGSLFLGGIQGHYRDEVGKIYNHISLCILILKNK